MLTHCNPNAKIPNFRPSNAAPCKVPPPGRQLPLPPPAATASSLKHASSVGVLPCRISSTQMVWIKVYGVAEKRGTDGWGRPIRLGSVTAPCENTPVLHIG